MPHSESIGHRDRPLRIAIIGSGPSGFYAAEALLKATGQRTSCDLFERLPTPYGLVRGGVAPDHQNIKRVINLYELIASNANLRYFGNVKVGEDIPVDALRSCYDCMIYAIGNESDRKLDVPGEHLPGCYSATEFVGWYNGHPAFQKRRFRLDCERAVVVGIGNVAMDVARVLARKPEELAGTDIGEHALQELASIQKLKEIYIIGRRGPLQSAFTPKEIRELGTLPNADLIVDPAELQEAKADLDAGRIENKSAEQNIRYLIERAEKGPSGKKRRIILRFLLSPVEFIAGPSGALEKVRLEKNKLVINERGSAQPKGIGSFVTIDATLAFKAVGYRGTPLPGVPFDDHMGYIPNRDGRVLQGRYSDEILPGEYTVGWSKRGPQGLIGTNKQDANETIGLLLEDYFGEVKNVPRAAQTPNPQSVDTMLREYGIRFVTFEDWKRIDAEEVRRGAERGKIREKFTTVDEMMSVLDHHREIDLKRTHDSDSADRINCGSSLTTMQRSVERPY